MLQIRKRLSRSEGLPEDFASHIYYEIYPEYRNRGYGKKILSLGLVEAGKIGLSELILTVYDNNVVSKKIIENTGGKLVGTLLMPDDRKFLKYKIVI